MTHCRPPELAPVDSPIAGSATLMTEMATSAMKRGMRSTVRSRRGLTSGVCSVVRSVLTEGVARGEFDSEEVRDTALALLDWQREMGVDEPGLDHVPQPPRVGPCRVQPYLEAHVDDLAGGVGQGVLAQRLTAGEDDAVEQPPPAAQQGAHLLGDHGDLHHVPGRWVVTRSVGDAAQSGVGRDVRREAVVQGHVPSLGRLPAGG